MSRRGYAILLFFVTALSLRLFDTRLVNSGVLNYIHFATSTLVILISIPYVFSKRGGMILPIQLIVAGVLLSIVMAKLSWSQGFMHSLIETHPHFTWIFFFFMITHKFSREHVERIVATFTVLYIVLFAYQFTHSSTIYFGKSLWGDEYTSDRGDIARIVFPGAGIFILGVLMAANKLTMERSGAKWFWAFLVLAGLLVPVLQLTREFIAGMLLLYLFHFMSYFSWAKRFAVVIGFVVIGFTIAFVFPNIIAGISESLERDLGEGKNYIRVLAANYYLFDFSPNVESAIFGNGTPYYGESVYGVYVENVELENGYYMSDVGIIGMYALFGIPAVVGWLLIWYKTFTIKLPKRYQYLKYYLWYLLMTSLTWYSVYHYHYIISTVICLSLFQRAIEDKSDTDE